MGIIVKINRSEENWKSMIWKLLKNRSMADENKVM